MSEENTENKILSIKIVSVDHYTCFPIKKLDVNHSEFRGTAVKQVPVVRIFGITQNKKKICANVHGVFPYFYVPCAETDPEKVRELMRDMANQLDKSVNTSLGQSNSISQHVYKISLVKGIPYYGYHQAEHQFLRIQLYNPNLLRRVSNLLQSGTILGKQFQPHESHIPYILKFFIDYNLFGMSYLHVPLQFVHTRYADDKTRFKKRSVSQIEVDFKAIYILNRLAAQEAEDTGKAANPGIESIWEDERLRRSFMDSQSVPPLESMKSQGKFCPPTDSEVFFKTILVEKLAEGPGDASMSTTMIEGESPVVKKKKFDLKNFLDSSVYAAEFSQSSFSTKSSQGSGKIEENVKIEGSDSNGTVEESKSPETPMESEDNELESIEELENQFLNFTQVDDDEQEMKEVLELLEDCGDEEFDDDSLLAPMTQVADDPEEIPQKKSQEFKKILEESDEEDFNELNVTVADLEIFSQYVEDDENFPNFPQLDGVDDQVKEPKKLSPTQITLLNDQAKNFHPQPGPSSLFISPLRKPIKVEAPSPSTSILNSQEMQESLKHLASQFKKSPEQNFSDDEVMNSDEDDDNDHIKSFYNQTMMVDDFWSEDEGEGEPMTEDDLNKTVMIDVDEDGEEEGGDRENEVKMEENEDNENLLRKSSDMETTNVKSIEENYVEIEDYEIIHKNLRRLNTRELKIGESSEIKSPKHVKFEVKIEPKEEVLEQSEDYRGKLRNFQEKPVNSPRISNKSQESSLKAQRKSETSQEISKELQGKSKNFDEKPKDFNAKPENFHQVPSTSHFKHFKTSESSTKSIKSEKFIITPALDPPDPSKVFESLPEFNIPNQVNPIPFYSNSKDVTGKKEVGHNLLEIPGSSLRDLDEFKSSLFQENCFESLRSEVFVQNFGFSAKTSKSAANFMSSNEAVTIQPYDDPPNFHDALDWLRSGTKSENLEESPVKDKREKTLMVLDIEEDLDTTLVPRTPEITTNSEEVVMSSQEKESSSLSDYIEDGLYLSYSARKKRNKMKKSFSKRFQEIMKAKVAAVLEPEPENSSQSSSNSQKLSSESMKVTPKNSQSSDDTKSDQTVIVSNANLPEDLSFNNSCDLTGTSLNNTYGFKMKMESLQTNEEHTDLTILAVEVHVLTRKGLKPNPEFDEISAVFYSLDGYYCGDQVKNVNGVIVNYKKADFNYSKQDVEIILVNSEMEIFEIFFQKVREYDPDIFAGYEIETASWGFLVQRGFVLNMNLNNALSRMPSEKAEKERAPVVEEEDHQEMGDYYSEQRIPGRILLDVWRLMKHEIALTSYTFENICYHVLHRRYPKHSFNFLASLWPNPLQMWIVLDYYVERSRTLIEILKQLDLIGRTCELAKLFGIQFYEVLSRGSQFRVESMMIRIAKRRNYVPVSPSVQQRAHMRAPEYIPLILEPESRFYSDPVIVLDFQSLYPSIIIGYNYCFSTCLGRVEYLTKVSSQPFEFGAYQLRVHPKTLQRLLDDDLVTISPCGVAFVKSGVREGVLPRMLREILDTRLMVKQSMKIHKSSALQRVLHSRQLGLKLIANVTYGYTAANFSGRMPAIEVGDSVVSKGRETLERAIKMVESNKEWRCRVAYGDTDSMFVLVPGRSREEAFAIGAKIAEAVTNDNPHPVKLKLEKVYQPCILQTKKRYVGFMYEGADQKEPVYEAKGIETVRRDGCPAAAKILEKTLRILFETYDVSKVKEYVCRQFTKILAGRCSIQDLLFAKEFRGINGYKEKACVPALMLTRKWKLSDPKNEPRRGERVPFLIVNGAPNLPLIRLVRTPLEVLKDENYKINSIYYITKAIIPPLNRCLLLIGANVFDWFAELPRRQQFIPLVASTSNTARKGTISQFFSTSTCATCENQCHQSICGDCRRNSQKTVLALTEKIFNLERKKIEIDRICQSCCLRSFETDCESLDCPVLYTRVRADRDAKQIQYYREILDEF